MGGCGYVSNQSPHQCINTDIVVSKALNISLLYTITNGKTLREPWERQNMERFFLLYEWMKIKNASYLFYADSDVVVSTRLQLNLLKLVEIIL